jgi:hypothetical protein
MSLQLRAAGQSIWLDSRCLLVASERVVNVVRFEDPNVDLAALAEDG